MNHLLCVDVIGVFTSFTVLLGENVCPGVPSTLTLDWSYYKDTNTSFYYAGNSTLDEVVKNAYMWGIYSIEVPDPGYKYTLDYGSRYSSLFAVGQGLYKHTATRSLTEGKNNISAPLYARFEYHSQHIVYPETFAIILFSYSSGCDKSNPYIKDTKATLESYLETSMSAYVWTTCPLSFKYYPDNIYIKYIPKSYMDIEFISKKFGVVYNNNTNETMTEPRQWYTRTAILASVKYNFDYVYIIDSGSMICDASVFKQQVRALISDKRSNMAVATQSRSQRNVYILAGFVFIKTNILNQLAERWITIHLTKFAGVKDDQRALQYILCTDEMKKLSVVPRRLPLGLAVYQRSVNKDGTKHCKKRPNGNQTCIVYPPHMYPQQTRLFAPNERIGLVHSTTKLYDVYTVCSQYQFDNKPHYYLLHKNKSVTIHYDENDCIYSGCEKNMESLHLQAPIYKERFACPSGILNP